MSDIKTKVSVSGSAEYKAEMQRMQQVTRELDSEMKALTSGFKDNEDAASHCTDKQKILDKQLANQQSTVDALKSRYSEMRAQCDVLAKAVAEAAAEFGENSTEAQKAQLELTKYQTATSKVKTQLNQAEAQLNGLSNSLEGSGAAADEAGGKMLSFGDIVKASLTADIIKAGAQAALDAAKSIARGIADITRQAVSSYADYEQLAGGIDVLFKGTEGAEIAKRFAANAYEIGMSTNEALETITGGAAAMIASLDGDYEEAARKSGMALNDMADNASKMGTSISSIQNAYAGFAKGQYSMLDNLKLGYGGTKNEMKRLLADAEAISGVKYDLDSYADIVDAIHVIQKDMGLTGQAAAEASETITGSLNATKAAWSNLLAGFANEDEDLDQLVFDLVDSAINAFNNIAPRIVTALTGASSGLGLIIKEVGPLLPGLIGGILPGLITGVENVLRALVEAAPQIFQLLVDMLPSILNALIEMLPDIILAGTEMIIALVEGIASALPDIIPAILQAVVIMVQTLLKHAPDLLMAGLELIGSLAHGIFNALDMVGEVCGQVFEKIKEKLGNLKDKALTWGKDMLQGFIDGIKSKIDDVANAAKGLGEKISEYLHFSRPDKGPLRYYEEWMPDFVRGLAQGIYANEGLLVDAASSAANAITSGIGINHTIAMNSAGAGATYDQLLKAVQNGGREVSVNVSLEGDAAGIFKVVRNENNRLVRATGYNRLGRVAI